MSCIKSLRQQGYTDEDIHDITQIAAYFNYLTRIADGLGIPPEEGLMDPWPARTANGIQSDFWLNGYYLNLIKGF